MESKTDTKTIPKEEILEAIDRYYLDSNKQHPCTSNRASEIGHPCDKYLVHARLDYEKAKQPDLGLIKIFEEGYIQELAVITMLQSQNVGYRIYNQNQTFPANEHQITGHVDGKIVDLKTDKGVYFDVKTLNPFIFNKINTIDDFDYKYWTLKWYAQAQIYMYLLGEQIFYFLIKNKSSGEIKIIECERKEKTIELLIEKAKRINRHVKKKKYPRGLGDLEICTTCKFLHLCLPEMTNNKSGTKIIENDEVQAAIETRELHKQAHIEYMMANDFLKAAARETGEGSFVVGNSYFWKVTRVNTKGYKVKPSSYLKNTVTKISENKIK